MPSGKGTAGHRQRGFTYVLLLFAIALFGIGLAVVADRWHIDTQREKELDLLFAGAQIRKALRSYVALTPPGLDPLPKSLDDLLEDRRLQPSRHHLRRRYVDPFTGKSDWLLIRRGNDLLGVASTSRLAPLKKSGFSADDADLANAREYRDWKFSIPPPPPPVVPIPSQMPPGVPLTAPTPRIQ